MNRRNFGETVEMVAQNFLLFIARMLHKLFINSDLKLY